MNSPFNRIFIKYLFSTNLLLSIRGKKKVETYSPIKKAYQSKDKRTAQSESQRKDFPIPQAHHQNYHKMLNYTAQLRVWSG